MKNVSQQITLGENMETADNSDSVGVAGGGGGLSTAVRRQGCHDKNTPPVHSKVKKMWIYISTAPYVSSAYLSTGRTLPLHYYLTELQLGFHPVALILQ
jgi:hypothetical protein